jgi:DNA-binding NarL/FixJ family response regulator
MLSKPNIILVDDHLVFREGLKSVLTIENIATVIGQASDGEEFIKLLPKLEPDLVLMDIEMPRMNGIEATRIALEMVPGLKIIVYSMFANQEYYDQVISLGAKGYILKSGGMNQVETAILEVMSGKKFFEPQR